MRGVAKTLAAARQHVYGVFSDILTRREPHPALSRAYDRVVFYDNHTVNTDHITASLHGYPP